MNVHPVIYAIRHKASGREYVGSSVRVKTRWQQHRAALARGDHHCIRLQRAWDKYGADAFAFVVLEEVTDGRVLFVVEQRWINRAAAFGSTYNSLPTAGSPLGYKHSDDTKAKWSAARKGKKKPEGFGLKIAAAKRGKTLSPETVAKIIANTPRGHTHETREGMSERMKGNTRRRGQKMPEGFAETIRKANTGKVRTEAQRENYRLAWVKRKAAAAEKQKDM